MHPSLIQLSRVASKSQMLPFTTAVRPLMTRISKHFPKKPNTPYHRSFSTSKVSLSEAPGGTQAPKPAGVPPTSNQVSSKSPPPPTRPSPLSTSTPAPTTAAPTQQFTPAPPPPPGTIPNSANTEAIKAARVARKYNLPNPPKSSDITSSVLDSQPQLPKKNRRIIRKLFYTGALIATAVVVRDVVIAVNSPGFHRSRAFWSRAFPIYIHYQAMVVWLDLRQYLTKVLIEYDHEYYAPILASLSLDQYGNPLPDSPEQLLLEQLRSPSETNQQEPESQQTEPQTPKLQPGTSHLTQWADRKAQADLDYIEKMRGLIADSGINPQDAQEGQNDQNQLPEFERPTPISQTQNVNKLDRLFANLNHTAQVLRESPEFIQLQARLEKLQAQSPTAVELAELKSELSSILDDTIAITAHIPPFNESLFWLKSQFVLLGGAIYDNIPLSDTTKDKIITHYHELASLTKEYIGKPAVKLIAPHIRHLAMPLKEAEIKQYRNTQFDPLNKHYAFDIYDIIAQLKGYYIKIGQLGAMRPEFLPKQWIHELSRFQNDCPHVEFSELVPMIEKELGPIYHHFRFIDPKPIGAASIGQVHLAELNNGQKVVVKLQYPDVEETFYHDMKTIRTFCELAQPEQLPQLAEIEAAFLSEFNFAREAVQLYFAQQDLHDAKKDWENATQEVKKNHLNVQAQQKADQNEFAHFVKIPSPIPHLCSKHVLVMEYLPGQRLATFLQNSVEKMAQQQGMSFDDFVKKYGSTPPPTTADLRELRTMASQYDYVTNWYNWAYNNTLGWFYPTKEYQKTEIPPDIRRIVKYVYEAHGNQIFNGHCLNSDPHPGNILFSAQENDLGGNIGLIDYGQVKSISLWHRTVLAHLMLALEVEDWERVANISFFGGFRSAHNYQGITVEQAVLSFDFDDDITRRGMNIESYFTHISGIDKPVHLQEKLVLAGQATFFLRALPQRLNFTTKTSQMWAPFARQFLSEHPVLDKVFLAGLDEFTEYYNKELITAKKKAIESVGNSDEYFVNLDHGFKLQDWAEAIGEKYNDEFYNQIFTSPFPEDLVQYGIQFDSKTGKNVDVALQKENATDATTATPSDRHSSHRKLRGERLLAITHSIDIDQFIPREGVDTPRINQHTKPYDFWAAKPQFVKKLQNEYIAPAKDIRDNV